jgi:hypothetical protein
VNSSATTNDLNDLFLDFHGKEVYDFEVNGSKILSHNVNFNKHRIQIPQSYLLPNSINRVNFKFSNTYVNNSAGLHKYVDPKDN